MQDIRQFMSAKAFAVAGASGDPEKYGHKCFAALLRRGYTVYPLNPRATDVLGVKAYPTVSALPPGVESLSIVTPPAVTEQVVADAIAGGIKHIWMQPGAESQKAIDAAKAAGLTVIADGACLLVELAKR